MTSITNNISNTSSTYTASIADVEKNPLILPKVFSFLSEKDRQCTHLTCKKWDIAASQSGQKITGPVVENGYGDFVLIDTTGKEVDFDTYKIAFRYMNSYLPQVHQLPVEDRLKAVNEAIQRQFSLKPQLKAIFIPRTLYELYYLLSGYKEEVALAMKGQTCTALGTCCHSYTYVTGRHNMHPQVKSLAWKLNALIVKELGIQDRELTEEQFQKAGQKILATFQRMNGLLDYVVPINEKEYRITTRVRTGVMIDPENLKKAISWECSKDSENTIILYRGSRFMTEPLTEDEGDEYGISPYCPCFGMSLFAGYTNDTNACGGARMFYDNETVRSYAVRIPLNKDWKDAFDIPKVNTICGLCAEGETFHARGKCISSQGSNIAGYANEATDTVKARFCSPLPEEALKKKLDGYFANSIEFPLKPKRITGSTADFSQK